MTNNEFVRKVFKIKKSNKDISHHLCLKHKKNKLELSKESFEEFLKEKGLKIDSDVVKSSEKIKKENNATRTTNRWSLTCSTESRNDSKDVKNENINTISNNSSIIKNEESRDIKNKNENIFINNIRKKIDKTPKSHESEHEDILLYNSELRNIIKNLDRTSRYLIIQYIKNKNLIMDNKSMSKIILDISNYYKSKEKFLKVKRCYRCNKYVVVKDFGTGHHVLPLEYGGDDSKYNKVFLCKDCHNYVELETLKLIELKKEMSINRLKIYIRTDFPQYNVSTYP